MSVIGPPDTFAELCGLVGSLVLLVGPLRDQLARRAISNWRTAEQDPISRMKNGVSAGLQNRASGWHAIDSGSIACGAILLALSFTLNV